MDFSLSPEILQLRDKTRQFIAEQLKADAGWTLVVDQLNESLHEDAVKRQTGLG